ncbi:MAG: hypothetical protein RLZZ324_753 [Candidatus Parcubacteria bacterium]|jgi:hypothetical protein
MSEAARNINPERNPDDSGVFKKPELKLVRNGDIATPDLHVDMAEDTPEVFGRLADLKDAEMRRRAQESGKKDVEKVDLRGGGVGAIGEYVQAHEDDLRAEAEKTRIAHEKDVAESIADMKAIAAKSEAGRANDEAAKIAAIKAELAPPSPVLPVKEVGGAAREMRSSTLSEADMAIARDRATRLEADIAKLEGGSSGVTDLAKQLMEKFSYDVNAQHGFFARASDALKMRTNADYRILRQNHDIKAKAVSGMKAEVKELRAAMADPDQFGARLKYLTGGNESK